MRTTLTLEDDLAAKLKAAMHERGESFKQTLNHFLRLGLSVHDRPEPMSRFVVRARDLSPRPGYDFDNVAELVTQAEGPRHR